MVRLPKSSECEALEKRRLGSATPATPTLVADHGVLTINGTAATDRVTIRSTDTGTVVRLTEDGSVRKRFAPGAVTGINIDGGGGRDGVSLDAASHLITATRRVERRTVGYADGQVTEDFATAVQPGIDAQGARHWLKRFARQKSRIDGASAKTLMIGDSLTEQMTTSGAEQWESIRAKYDALDLGFSGDTTTSLLYRIKTGLLEGLWPKTIFLSIGTNNIALTDNVTSTVRGIRKVITTIQSMRPKTQIVLSSILPRGMGRDPKVVDAVNGKLDDLAAAYDAVFADARRAFTPQATAADDFDNRSVHLSPGGYARWTPVIDNALHVAASRSAKRAA